MWNGNWLVIRKNAPAAINATTISAAPEAVVTIHGVTEEPIHLGVHEALTSTPRLETETEGAADTLVVLSNGAVFRYYMDFDIGGGSGGPAANLIGRLDLGTHTLSVVCHDQAERGPQPHWCAPYLHHLKVADGS